MYTLYMYLPHVFNITVYHLRCQDLHVKTYLQLTNTLLNHKKFCSTYIIKDESKLPYIFILFCLHLLSINQVTFIVLHIQIQKNTEHTNILHSSDLCSPSTTANFNHQHPSPKNNRFTQFPYKTKCIYISLTNYKEMLIFTHSIRSYLITTTGKPTTTFLEIILNTNNACIGFST